MRLGDDGRQVVSGGDKCVGQVMRYDDDDLQQSFVTVPATVISPPTYSIANSVVVVVKIGRKGGTRSVLLPLLFWRMSRWSILCRLNSDGESRGNEKCRSRIEQTHSCKCSKRSGEKCC